MRPKRVLEVDLDKIKPNVCAITGWEDRVKKSILTQEEGEWVLKSKDGSRVLRHYGKNKPSEAAVEEDEKDIRYFKHKDE